MCKLTTPRESVRCRALVWKVRQDSVGSIQVRIAVVGELVRDLGDLTSLDGRLAILAVLDLFRVDEAASQSVATLAKGIHLVLWTGEYVSRCICGPKVTWEREVSTHQVLAMNATTVHQDHVTVRHRQLEALGFLALALGLDGENRGRSEGQSSDSRAEFLLAIIVVLGQAVSIKALQAS